MGRASAGNRADPDRLGRVMDAKQRLIGVDVPALDAQVAEKAQAKQRAKTAEDHYAATASSHVGMLTMGQLGAAELRKGWDKEVAEFRAAFQGKATTREYDLNRGDAKRLDLPARLGDDDMRCGPASLQRFAGEDLQIGERVAAQMAQCQAWWDEQSALAAGQKELQAAAELEEAAAVRHLDALQLSAVAQEAAARVELEAQVAAANSSLRGARAALQQDAQQQEEAAKLAELEAARTDPWLAEAPEQAASMLSPLRVRTDHWKGMSREQLAAIKQQQTAQQAARREAEAAQAAVAAEAAARQRDVQRAVALQAQAAQALRRQQAAATAAALKEQMALKAARDAELQRVYENRVSPDFFAQFGTSHR